LAGASPGGAREQDENAFAVESWILAHEREGSAGHEGSRERSPPRLLLMPPVHGRHDERHRRSEEIRLQDPADYARDKELFNAAFDYVYALTKEKK